MAVQTLGITADREQSMPIRLQCEDCGAKIRVPEGAEGRKIKCPKCGAILRAPGPDTPDTLDETVQTGEDFALDSLAAASDTDALDDQESSDITDSELSPAPPEQQQFDEPSPPDLDQLAQHQDHDEDHTLEDAENPLSALAAMSDTDDAPPVDNAFEPEPPADDDHPLNELFDEPDPEPALSSPEAPTATAAKAGIPLARPRPLPVPQPNAESITGSSRKHRDSPKPQPQPQPTETEPKAIPLSSQHSSTRPQGVPLPLSTEATGGPSPRPGAYPAIFLLMVGWLLRVMAFLAVGGSAKLMLVAWDLKWPIGECLLVLLAGLLSAAIAWGIGEIALAVRHMLTNRR